MKHNTGKVILIGAGVVALIGLIGLITFAVQIYESGFWRGPDAQFGDQHLKTSVALIELHKIRQGRYPKSLNDLRYVGDWDKIGLGSVRYVPNEDQSKYCVEVVRGWIGKPDLKMPDEFWQGTGYDPVLCQQK